jgi:xanthine dehydrogenase YagS FAD-binding subunit
MKLGVVDALGFAFDRIEELSGGGVRIGAAVSTRELAADARIRERYPVVSQAALLSGAPGRVPTAAATANSLLERAPAVTGHGRELAILGASGASVAAHRSDLAVAFAALDAVVRTAGPDGERVIPITELHRLPDREHGGDTVLRHGERITAVDLPPLTIAVNSRYGLVREGASSQPAVVSVAAALEVTDGVVRDVRVALGGVAPRPWRAAKVADALRGAPATTASFRRAAESELAPARPLLDNGLKVAIACNLIVRTLALLR